ncbi:MAG: hypothetical protein NT158_10220, partial [Cyanobacteria bacterium]|nr:hypothetical protein [Cyanobacteriota bacterium]
FRHPLVVAQSLQHRNQYSLDKGLDLWRRYNRKLLDYQAMLGFPIISFDLPDPVLREKLFWLLGCLEIPAATQDLQFFDPALRHYQFLGDAILPQSVSTLYDKLTKLASIHETDT